jgi:hypothetical protein
MRTTRADKLSLADDDDDNEIKQQMKSVPQYTRHFISTF